MEAASPVSAAGNIGQNAKVLIATVNPSRFICLQPGGWAADM
ncbi:hypothetical protein SZ54_4907 [Rhizobium sp. UR51a]|nr:hypothetical protein SZ54_4907 [Rhizobium sp. UR51a]